MCRGSVVGMASRKPFDEKPLAAWCEQFRSSPAAEERYRALQAIVALAGVEDAIGWLTPGLLDAEASIRAGAARWLASQAELSPRPGSDAAWQTIRSRWQALLADDDPDVRFEAARGLILLDAEGNDAACKLSELLHDDETQPVMLAAILELYRRIEPSAVAPPAWSRFLQHEQSAVREAAARALGPWAAGSEQLARDLLPLLDDEDPFVREEAARALGVIGVSSAEILAALSASVSDEDDVVAAAARAALQRLQK